MTKLYRGRLRFIISNMIIIVAILLGTKLSIAASGTFYVQPIFPDNQLSDASDYYHIKVNGDVKQSFDFMIVNDSSEDKVFDVNVLDGMTTSSGEISYSTDHPYDDSQIIKLSEVMSGSGEKTVSANSSLKVEMALDLSINKFSGQLLGAINITEKQDDANKNGGVQNQFAYNIPIKIDVNELTMPAKMSYKKIEVKEETNSYDLEVTLSNTSPLIIRDLSIEYDIKSKKSKQSIFKQSDTHLELAPNSLFSPKLSLKDTDIKSGEYTISIHAISKESHIDETWEADFSINREQASNLNNGLVVSNDSSKTWIILGIALVVILVIGFVVYKKTRTNKK